MRMGELSRVKIPFKQWLAEIAEKRGVKPTAIFQMVKRGRAFWPDRERVSGCEYAVEHDAELFIVPKLPTRYSEAKRIAAIEGVGVSAIYNRQNKQKQKEKS